MSKGKVIVISAAAGTGKGTVISRILQMRGGIELSVSATTRAPRPGEIDGVHYYFVTREKFGEMIEAGQFLEHAEFVGNLYGTPLPPLIEKTENGINVILEIDVQGFFQVKEKVPDCVTIFLAPPSLEELERRLRGRGTEDEPTIKKRLEVAKTELLQAEKFDYIVVNDIVDRAAEKIVSIIEKEQE